jgi:type VII secretion integral membrane protein EccD
MAASAATAAAMLPLTVVFYEEKNDVALPGNVAVAEILPGLVSSLGQLNADNATRGFELKTSSGRVLSQSETLSAQNVHAGALLLLEPTSMEAGQRYDDLVEAMGKSVDATRAPWQRGDSIQLSAYAAVGLLAVAAALLVFGPGPTSDKNTNALVAAIVGIVGAMLVVLAAALVARVQPKAGPGIALAMAAPGLAGAATYAYVGMVQQSGGLGQSAALRLVLTGVAILIFSAAVFVLPKESWGTGIGPLVVGVVLVGLGSLEEWVVPFARPGKDVALLSASAVTTICTIVTLVAPWIGLAQMPARIDALSETSTVAFKPRDVATQLRSGDRLVIALRVATGACTVVLTWFVATTGLGAALMLASGLALMLGTRSLYGRAEAMAGMVSGILVVVLAGVRISLASVDFLPWVIGAAILVAVFVLANNVVTPRMRPGFARAADSFHVVALLALLPLLAAIWGFTS